MNFFINNKLIDINKISIVPGSGVDVDGFNNYRKIENKKLTFLLVSRLLKDKGIYEYIESAKLIKKEYQNIEFLLAGQFDNGNPSAIDKQIVDKWEKENIIKYIGITNSIEDFFRLTDIVVLPSYREGLSRVLIEAASCYKPLIATNVPGCKDVVKNGYNGFLCEVKNKYSLYDTIVKMINTNAQERKKMSLNSYQLAKNNFDKDIVNNIYFESIQNIV